MSRGRTRSSVKDVDTVYEWQYLGTNHSNANGSKQHAKHGDLVEDDCVIIHEGRKVGKQFYFKKQNENGDVVGWFLRDGVRVSHTRTHGHVSVVNNDGARSLLICVMMLYFFSFLLRVSERAYIFFSFLVCVIYKQ